MSMRTYLRDGRAPVPKSERTSAIMSRIRAKNTGPERALREALRVEGLTGYRLHYARAPGRPDVAFVGDRVAVFVHGCFWHGCPHHPGRRVKSHGAWWRRKIGANKARDRRKVAALRRDGWRVVTIWECRLKKGPVAQLRKVQRALAAASGR
jgi:DNA mismatch endonuclease (patch repair protein)